MKSRVFLFTGQWADALTLLLFFALTPASTLALLPEHERNPLTFVLLAATGTLGFAALKLTLPLLVVLLDRRRPTRLRLTQWLMLGAGVTGFVGATFNLVALFTILGAL